MLTTPIMINASVHDQSNMIVYFMSYVPDNYKYSFCLSLIMITISYPYINNLLPYMVAVESLHVCEAY